MKIYKSKFEIENQKTAPRNAAAALAAFKILSKKQKTTPVLIASNERGLTYGLKEFPTFKAHFNTFVGAK